MESAIPVAPPAVRLQVHTQHGRPTVYEVGDGGFLIGTVPGCDLRLPPANLAPVVGLVLSHPDGVVFRKLAPLQAGTANGRPVTATHLNDGDRIALGAVEIVVNLSADAAVATAARKSVSERPRDEAAAKEHEELLQLRQELATIREQLYERYHTRRDKLHAKQKALRKAADKLIARKRDLDAKTGQIGKSQQEWSLREAELAARTEQVQRERQIFEEQARELGARQQELQRTLAERVQEVEARERQLAEERAALESSQKQHQNDLVRLDRAQAALEQQRKQLHADALDVDHRFEQLQRDSRDLEEQAKRLDEWHQRLTTDAERQERQKQEQETTGAQINQRAAAVEGQQAMLATLRTRLERMREELRRQEQAVNDQRVAQEVVEADLRQRALEARTLREELDNDKKLFEEEHRRLQEKQATMGAAVAQLRQAQESLAGEEKVLHERQQSIDTLSAEQAEQAGLLLARGNQLDELHQRLKADREALQAREGGLAQSEQTLAALQEQLRRRSEELAERQRLLDEQDQKLAQEQADLESRRQMFDQQDQQAAERLEGLRLAFQAREDELAKQTEALAAREANLRARTQRLEETGTDLATQQEKLVAERVALETQRQAAADAAAQVRKEFEATRAEAVELQRQSPEIEARAAAALERLTRGREQLREHLSEIHAYARQSREDLEAARQSVQADIERLRRQELSLHAGRDEHRLAVAAFRQQLIEWQGQVGEMKQSLLRGENQLDRRRAEVDAQAQQIATSSARLARQAEELEQQERQVAEKRGEMDRHLSDMREWYRRKLRELAGVDQSPEDDPSVGTGGLTPRRSLTPMPGATVAAADEAPGRDILSLTGEADTGDRQLGELLRSLELIDADTLRALVLEARRQRRSLRQLLLSGNYLTLYQMALIEASNLDALVLGPVRVVDRLGATPHEVVFRVFDPRHEREAMLRHLAEEEMQDAVRPDEFRQRFGAAAGLLHPNIAATYEVLDIHDRPAALQEWLRGVPSTEWPSLAGAPGVWFRLLGQAALALHTAHQAGLVHGRLGPEAFVFTGEGLLKIRGFGEPRWLGGNQPNAPEATPADDLYALGPIAAAWATLGAAGKKPAPKPFPDILQTILQHLTAANEDDRFPGATALLDELERVSAEVPASQTAWDRFINFARDQAGDSALRRSA